MTQTNYTDSGISPRTTVYAERTMLKWAAPVVVLDKFGASKPMPANKGQVIKFRRPRTFTPETVPLQEGVTPTARAFAYEDVPATLKQYGMLVQISDVIEDTHEDPVLNDASKQCGENAGRTIEALTYGVLKAGTNVFYNNGTQRTDVNTAITLVKQRAVVRALNAQKGMPITSVMDGSVNFKTSPIQAAFIGVGHTDLESDIQNLAGFVPVAEYGQRKPIHPQELGSVEKVRYVLSPDLASIPDAGGVKGSTVSTAGTSSDVYPVLFFAQDAYGSVPLRGQGSMEPVIIPVGKRDKSDPLGQRGYVGWKTWFVAVILNQAWMARLECAVTAL